MQKEQKVIKFLFTYINCKKMKKKNTNKAMFTLKTRIIDIHEGEDLVVLINEEDAREHGITSMDKVSLIYDDKEFVFDVNLSDTFVQR